MDHWVRAFFHPRTLKETLAAFKFCLKRREWFLAACLCGILHHQRPGFLSYPASHMVPYLRTTLFPPEKFPELYEYRPLADRLRKKVKRAYRRHNLPSNWAARQYEVTSSNARSLPFEDESVDLVLTSPPYYDALDYARDNRLRLWFLGLRDWRVAQWSAHHREQEVRRSDGRMPKRNASHSTARKALRTRCRRGPTEPKDPRHRIRLGAIGA